MNQPLPPDMNIKTSAAIDHALTDLPEALLRHVEAGRLDINDARDLAEELEYQTEIITHHRNNDRQSNLVFLDNFKLYEKELDDDSLTPHEVVNRWKEALHVKTLLIPENAAFNGDETEIGAFLFALASAAKERFTMQSHEWLRGKDDVAFDFGHVDQRADWNAPNALDKLVERATNIEVLSEEFPFAHPSVILHERTHARINYKFLRTAMTSRPSVMVIRKRPYADVILEIEGEPICIQIFRKSWFLVTASETEEPTLAQYINKARNGQVDHDNPALTSLRHLIDDVLAMPNQYEQAAVFPCTMTYVARIKDPRIYHANQEHP